MPKLDVGFTGTRRGWHPKQGETARGILLSTPIKTFHHGCCIGADQDAMIFMYDHFSRKSKRVEVHGYPPTNPKYMSIIYSEFCDVVHPPAGYHERDEAIVDACQLLVATPLSATYEEHSGTWHTITYAQATVVPVLLIKPDGSSTYI